MTDIDPGALPVAVLDAHRLSDEALTRLAVGATSVTAFRTRKKGADKVRRRWSTIAPEIPFEDGGLVDDIREAIIEAARRQILVVATAEPNDPDRFLGLAAQGAASATEFNVPSVAVHVLRDVRQEGPVAWVTQTGEMSGYGVLFAVGFAQLHGAEVVLIEPSGGTRAPRTKDAVDDAIYAAVGRGVRLTKRSDASPVDAVLRDPYRLVVHPVLDVPGGRALLRPGELPVKSLTEGTPGAVIRLIEEFPGDVVAVFDGVRLVHGAGAAARMAAAVALGLTGVAGISASTATAAAAAPVSTSAAAATATQAQQADLSPGVILTTSGGHEGQSHTGSFHVENHLDHAVTLHLTALWTHHGAHEDKPVQVVAVNVPAGGSQDVPIPRPVPPGSGGGGGGYHLSTGRVEVTGPGGQVLVSHQSPWSDGQPPAFPAKVPGTPANQVPPEELSPQFRPVTVTGTQETITGEGKVPPVEGTTHAAFKDKGHPHVEVTPDPPKIVTGTSPLPPITEQPSPGFTGQGQPPVEVTPNPPETITGYGPTATPPTGTPGPGFTGEGHPPVEVTPNPPETITGYGPTATPPTGTPGPGFTGQGQPPGGTSATPPEPTQATPTPTPPTTVPAPSFTGQGQPPGGTSATPPEPTQATPTPTPHQVPTATPTPKPSEPPLVPPRVVTGEVPPPVTGTSPVPTGTPGPTIEGHSMVPSPGEATPTPGGTDTPGEPTTGGTTGAPGGETPTPPSTTAPPETTTPTAGPTAPTGTATPPETGTPVQAAGRTTTNKVPEAKSSTKETATTSTAPSTKDATTETAAAPGGPTLAHTGAATTGLLAKTAAALLAAGAGLSALARRRREDEGGPEGASPDDGATDATGDAPESPEESVATDSPEGEPER